MGWILLTLLELRIAPPPTIVRLIRHRDSDLRWLRTSLTNISEIFLCIALPCFFFLCGHIRTMQKKMINIIFIHLRIFYILLVCHLKFIRNHKGFFFFFFWCKFLVVQTALCAHKTLFTCSRRMV